MVTPLRGGYLLYWRNMSKRKTKKKHNPNTITRNPRVGIYTLCPRNVVDTGFMRSLTTLFLVDGGQTISGLHTTHTARSALGRSQAVAHFLTTPLEYLMWIDSDMVFTPEAYFDLFAEAMKGHKIVTGLAFMYDEGAKLIMPNIFMWNDESHQHEVQVTYEKDASFWCDATGVAFTLIHRSIFEGLIEHGYEDNWHFDWHEHPATGTPMGHDVAFFWAARTLLGERVWYVSKAKTGHRKTVEIAEENFEQMMTSYKALRNMPEEDRPPLTEKQLAMLKPEIRIEKGV